ncbi:MAG: hypothetical protein P8170_22410 [Gemmatimonadota bacterium]|jgi:hypothetical protein
MKPPLAVALALAALSCAAPPDDVLGPQFSTLAEGNQSPTAEVATECGYMWCTFDGLLEGRDPDGTIVACRFLIGGQTYPYCKLYYEWSTEGTKTIQFSVWDNDDAVGTTTFDVHVVPSPITVSTQYTRVKKENRITVTWHGADGALVDLVRTGGDPDVYENPMVREDLVNDGEWIDVFTGKCVGFVYTIYEVEGPEYSYPPHRSTCEEEGNKGKGRNK